MRTPPTHSHFQTRTRTSHTRTHACTNATFGFGGLLLSRQTCRDLNRVGTLQCLGFLAAWRLQGSRETVGRPDGVLGRTSHKQTSRNLRAYTLKHRIPKGRIYTLNRQFPAIRLSLCVLERQGACNPGPAHVGLLMTGSRFLRVRTLQSEILPMWAFQ